MPRKRGRLCTMRMAGTQHTHVLGRFYSYTKVEMRKGVVRMGAQNLKKRKTVSCFVKSVARSSILLWVSNALIKASDNNNMCTKKNLAHELKLNYLLAFVFALQLHIYNTWQDL